MNRNSLLQLPFVTGKLFPIHHLWSSAEKQGVWRWKCCSKSILDKSDQSVKICYLAIIPSSRFIQNLDEIDRTTEIKSRMKQKGSARSV